MLLNAELGLSAVACRAALEPASDEEKANEIHDLVLRWLDDTGAGRGLTRRWKAALCAAFERDRAARRLILPRLVAVRQPVDA